MGNCSYCSYCNDHENESINNSIRISTNSILGQYSQSTPSNSMCCCIKKSTKNKDLLDNIKLSKKAKRIFERRISINKKTTKGIIKKIDGLLGAYRYYDTYGIKSEKLDISDNSISISNRLLINEINQSPEKKYKMLHNIGNGSYGDVFLAYNIYTKEKVAIKKIYKTTEDLLSDGKITDEIKILKSLNHPDIVIPQMKHII